MVQTFSSNFVSFLSCYFSELLKLLVSCELRVLLFTCRFLALASFPDGHGCRVLEAPFLSNFLLLYLLKPGRFFKFLLLGLHRARLAPGSWMEHV